MPAQPGAAKYYIRHLLIGLIISSGVLVATVSGRVYDTDPESPLQGVMRYIGQHPGVLRADPLKEPPVHRDVWVGTGGVQQKPGGEKQSPGGGKPRDLICDGCLSAMSFLKTLILVGIKWDDVRDDVVSICKIVVVAKNWRGDILCPQLMDNFGPLVYDAIKESRKSAKKICIHMNWCDPYEMSSYPNSGITRGGRDVTANYIRHFHDVINGINLDGVEGKMAAIKGLVQKPTLQPVVQGQDHPEIGQGQVLVNVGQGVAKVKTPILPVPHVPHGLRTDDLPMISKLLSDLRLGGTDFLQRFKNYVHLLSSPDSWNNKVPIKNLIAQSKVLELKIKKAMTNLQAKDSIKPDARRMAELIGAALTRTSKRLRRHLVPSTSNTLKVAQLADIHVEEDYLTGAATDCGLPVCCHSDSEGPGAAGVWGDGACNAPPSTIRKLMRSAALHNPDIVVYTGDNPPHTVWLETLEKQLNASRWVARELAAHFPTTTVYPNLGNHENFPLNLYYVPRPETQMLNHEWAEMFKPVAGFGPEQISTINKAGYYTMLIKPGLRLIAYNTNYGGVGNFMNILNYDRTEFLEMVTWLENTLAQARNNSERVFLTSHHEAGMQENVVSFDEVITPILVEYSDVIVWHPCGHMHRDEFRLNLDPETGDPVGVTFIAQSMNTYPDINPGYRIYYFDPDTYEPLDYEQYFIDIKKANENPGSDDIVSLSYRASEMYGLVDLTPPSMMALYNRLMTDDALLQRYWTLRRGGTGVDGTCDAFCRQSQQCHIISPTYDVYRACMRHHARGNGTTSHVVDLFMDGVFNHGRTSGASGAGCDYGLVMVIGIAFAVISAVTSSLCVL